MGEFKRIESLIRMALEEDIGGGDITTKAVVPEDWKSKGEIIVKEDGVIAGLPIAQIVFNVYDKRIKFRQKVKDGSYVKKGVVIAEVFGPARSILACERLALNLLQRMSGIATLTRKFKEKISNHKNTQILDTRKTVPLWRAADKYAVMAGGGQNHRMGLYDAVLIKDNHIKIAGSIKKAIERCRASISDMPIEVEAKNIKEVKEAVECGVDRILLDNMSVKEMKDAVRLCRKAKILTEASGGVNLENVKEIAKTGVDFISIGALTHSPKALDISLKIR